MLDVIKILQLKKTNWRREMIKKVLWLGYIVPVVLIAFLNPVISILLAVVGLIFIKLGGGK